MLGSALGVGNRHSFIQPSSDICDSALDEAKRVLDGVAARICGENVLGMTGKRKRGLCDETGPDLKIRMIHTDGFEVKQVWEQARRIIDATRAEVERELEESGILGDDNTGNKNDGANGVVYAINVKEDGPETNPKDESVDEDEDEYDYGKNSNAEFLDQYQDTVQYTEASEAVATGGDKEDPTYDLEGIRDVDNENESLKVFVEDPNGLNDGFFSIDEFNKHTEFLEQQDTAGDPFTGEASDEEDIDWDADPMSMPIPRSSISRRDTATNNEDDVSGDRDEDEDEEDQGPTFGNVDLDASEGENDDEDGSNLDSEVLEIGKNTNDILYKDFFQPPLRKVQKGERQARFLDRQTRKSKSILTNGQEVDIERAMAGVRRDLFEDNPGKEDYSESSSDANPSDPKSKISTHERRQASLAAEIRRLEAASITKREWVLAGEARAADRPVNSLLEEDLDFERTGKPVPVITAEVSESIEELIKRRILAQEFDEVIRRRPNLESVPINVRRGVFELDDTKPQQSLAEIYEEDHMKATNPDTYMSKTDDKLKKQHQEVETLWKEVSAKLDVLSSWHYKPRPPIPSLTVIADVATVSMEDAQPTTAAGLARGVSMLAPQEIYKPGKDKGAIGKGEVVLKNGVPVSKQEMTREDKKRRRRREKERMKKMEGGKLHKKQGTKSRKKNGVLGELKRGGVKVISRRGEIRDIDGNNIRAASTVNGASGFKL